MKWRPNANALAFAGLACVLVVAALILWRPFESSSPSKSKPTPPPEREVHFPEDRSIGELYVRDWESTWRVGEWWPFGQAEGTVTVPFGKELRLRIDWRLAQDLSALAEIEEHDLQSLHLSGAEGAHVFQWSPDRTIRMLTDEDLRFIRGLWSLRELILFGAVKISDAGMEHIGILGLISELDISGTNVTDNGLAEIERLPFLRRLSLRGNRQISDTSLMHLRSLTRLEHLDLTLTSITDKGITYLQSMRSLKTLILLGTQITPNGVAALKRALPNCQIHYGKPTPSPTPTPSPQVPVS